MNKFRKGLQDLSSIKTRRKISKKINLILDRSLTKEQYEKLEHQVTKLDLDVMTDQKIQEELDRLQKLRFDAIASNYHKLEQK